MTVTAGMNDQGQRPEVFFLEVSDKDCSISFGV